MNEPFGENRTARIARRCRDEALAVQDMLTPSPAPPTLIRRAIARLLAAVGGLGRQPIRDRGGQRRSRADGVVTSQPAE